MLVGYRYNKQNEVGDQKLDFRLKKIIPYVPVYIKKKGSTERFN